MARFVTLFAFTAGGAATYLWMKENGGFSQVDGRIDDVANKVRRAFGVGPSNKHVQRMLIAKAKNTTNMNDSADDA